MNNTYFSIIVPVYNAELEYIRQTINSVINIDYSNYEIILIDDGSKKEVADLVDNYKDNCVIHHQQNKGYPTACLEGVKLAKGDYIIIVDCDDIINPNCLNIYDSIISKYNCDVVMHDFVIFHENISEIKKHNPHFSKGIVNKEEVVKQLCKLNISATWSRTARRELYDGMISHLDTTLKNGDDTQMSAYLIKNANSFYYTDEIIYYYRVIEKHKDYYDISNLNDANFLYPVYNILFKDNNEFDYALPFFKTSIANSHVYNAFRICLWINNKKERYDLLDKLNLLEITKINNTINTKLPFVSNILYTLLVKKQYGLLTILSHVYDLIFNMQKL